MHKTKKKIVGITMGDPCGIGAEVIAKSLLKPSVRHLTHFQIIGDEALFQKFGRTKFSNCTFLNLTSSIKTKWMPGHPSQASARASLSYINCAIELIKKGDIDALVTGPVSKEGISSLNIKFEGHTEYLAQAFAVKHFAMMFVAKSVRAIIVTRHIPVSRVSAALRFNTIYDTISLGHQTLKNYFKIARPHIAVCGLNPHAGEGGKIGWEEIKTITPAISKAQNQGIKVSGPFSGDTIFVPKISNRYDMIIAMYHDQGLAAIKALYFDQLVNLTVGLPFIRTCPAHGTAFDIAGRNQANPESMCAAIKLAAELS